MFKYWKYGSEIYEKNEEFKNKYKDYTINDYVNLIKNNSPALNGNSLWKIHYAPTSEWINNSPYKNIIIINYEKNLNNKIDKLLDLLKIEKIHDKLPIKNITQSKDEDIVLDEESLKFIREYYKDDFKLYYDILYNPQLFRAVI